VVVVVMMVYRKWWKFSSVP